MTGTVAELDRDFAAQLNSYTSAVVKLGSNLDEIEATHRAAVKALEEEKKKDLDRRRGKANSSKANPEPEPKPGPVIKDGKPVFGTRDGADTPSALTLFDAAPEATVPTERSGVQAAGTGSAADGDRRVATDSVSDVRP